MDNIVRMLKKSSLMFVTILILANPINVISPLFSNSTQLNQEYMQILRLMGLENYEKAIDNLKKMIEKNPSFSRAYTKIVEAYTRNNQLREGISYFELLREINPDNPYIYHGLGLIYAENGDFEQAIQNYLKGICKKPEHPAVYKNFIDAHYKLNRLEEAVNIIKELINSNQKNAAALYGMGYIYQLQKEWIKGLEALSKSLELNSNLLEAYHTKGIIYWYTGKYQDLLQISSEGLKIAQRTNDLEYQCTLFGNISLAYLYMTNHPEALKYCKQALKVAQDIGYKAQEVRNLGNLGVIYRDMGKLSGALSCFNEAVAKAKQIGDRRREGLFYRNIGSVYHFMDDYPNALIYYMKSLPIIVEIGDQNSEALTLWSIGWIYRDFGDYKRSLEYCQQAYDMAVKLGDKWGEERYLAEIGVTLAGSGEYSRALECYEDALNIARKIGDKSGEARTIGRIADIYCDIGEYSRGLVYCKNALKIVEEIGDKSEQGAHLGDIGVVYHIMGNYDLALEYYQRALQIVQEIKNRRYEALFLGNLGYLYFRMGDYTSASHHIKEALNIAREIKHKRTEGFHLCSLGDLNLRLDDCDSALRDFSKALEIGKKTDIREILFYAHSGLAGVYEIREDYEKSLIHYQESIKEIEKVRKLIMTEEFKTGFLENKIRIYENIIGLFAKLHKMHPLKEYDRIAFHYAERAKARTLLDIIYQGRIFNNLAAIPDDFRQKLLITEKQIENKHLKLSNELAKSQDIRKDDMIDSLKKEIESLQRTKAELYHELNELNPGYYRLANPKLIDSKEVQNRILSDNQVMLEYIVGGKNIFVWILTKEQVKLRTIELTRKELEAELAAVSPLFSKEKAVSEVRIDHQWANFRLELLQNLYNVFVENPAGEFLNPGTELIIIPDDLLCYFPFEILVTGQDNDRVHYLIENHPISYASSASLLNPDLQKERNAREDLLAFGNPYLGEAPSQGIINWIGSFVSWQSILRGNHFAPLPHAEMEVKAIAENFSNPDVFIDKQATEERLKRMAKDYRFIHLATHFLTNDRQPMYSKIILAQTEEKKEDGYLQTYEVYNMSLNAEMVVLGGCNSGLGKLSRGEGLIGMTRAFLYAGVPSIVVSMWPVDDESTALLMKEFYNNLKNGLSKTKALQKAKIELINSKDWKRDPFYWGAFILIGDGDKVTW